LPEAQAIEVEALIHRKLRNNARRLAGETYCFDGEEAQKIIEAALASLGINVPEKVPHPDMDDGGRYHHPEYAWLTRLGKRRMSK